MTAVTIDQPTGSLVVDGTRAFPIVVSGLPPVGAKSPSGRDALAELAAGGVTFVRTGRADWSQPALASQLAAERARLDEVAAHRLHAWLWLGDVANLPATPGSPNERLLRGIVGELGSHPALGAWKGIDEPANPFRPAPVPAAGLARAYTRLKALDAAHPVVIVQAPTSTLAQLEPYRPAFDVTGADVYPVSYPPGAHLGGNPDIGVVGDVTRKMVEAAGGKPVWTALQIAWSGVTPTRDHPAIVPRFPTLAQERFMAYQAIVAGARGLSFYGGHVTEVMRPSDAELGWNWTFWTLVLRPLLAELTSTALQPALVAPHEPQVVQAAPRDVEVLTRRDDRFLYVIAVRRGAATTRVSFSGLPRRHDGTALAAAQVLFEYAQEPPSPPVQPGHQEFRSVGAANGSFSDWFGPEDVHVYRFRL